MAKKPLSWMWPTHCGAPTFQEPQRKLVIVNVAHALVRAAPLLLPTPRFLPLETFRRGPAPARACASLALHF
jgi:hypothetical protein